MSDDDASAAVLAFLKLEKQVAFFFEQKMSAARILALAIDEHRALSEFLTFEEMDTNT